MSKYCFGCFRWQSFYIISSSGITSFCWASLSVFIWFCEETAYLSFDCTDFVPSFKSTFLYNIKQVIMLDFIILYMCHMTMCVLLFCILSLCKNPIVLQNLILCVWGHLCMCMFMWEKDLLAQWSTVTFEKWWEKKRKVWFFFFKLKMIQAFSNQNKKKHHLRFDSLTVHLITVWHSSQLRVHIWEMGAEIMCPAGVDFLN